MENMSGKNILIVGNSATEYSLAKKLAALDEVEKVFVASGNDATKEFAAVVDIREDSVQELLEFSLENAIDLTIASSENAIKADIASVFQQNGQMIFAPTLSSADICVSKSAGKKFMYKSHIPCPKFGIFDKVSFALDYVKKSQMPVVVKTDCHQGDRGTIVCSTFQIAKNCIESLFDSGEKKVIVEDFVMGHEFSLYVVTDGYKALSLGTVANYKYELDGNGGHITSGMGAFAPDYKISAQLEKRILQQVIYPTLNYLARNYTPYVGILGVDCVLTHDENLCVIEFNSFLQAPDSQCILTLLDENIYQLIHACVVGSFADDYESVDIADKYAASCVLASGHKSGAIIQGLDDLDEATEVAHFNTKKNNYLEYETRGGRGNRALTLTRSAKTLSRAIDNLYEEISVVNFDGMKFRKDVGKIY